MFGFGEPEDSAIAILIADHRKVDELFKQFEAETAAARKRELALRICDELTVHAKAEEEVFYPQSLVAFEREKMADDRRLVWEATVEHGTLEGLIAVIQDLRAGDEQLDSHVKVLKEYVKHHVREEEDQMFPTVRKTSLDMKALGRQIKARKTELRAQMGRANGKGRQSSGRATGSEQTGRSSGSSSRQ